MKKGRFKKLSTKFVILCTIPASILLISLCMGSIVITDHMSCKHLRSSLEGQSIAKIHDLDAAIDLTLKNINFDEQSSKVLNLIDQVSDDAVKEKSAYNDLQQIVGQIQSTSTYFSWVGIADIRNEMMIDSEGQKEYRTDTNWYNSQKLNDGVPYFTQNSILINTDSPLFVYTYPVKDESTGEIVGAVILYFNNNFLIDKLKMETNFPEQMWLISDQDSQILFHSKGYNRQIIDKVEKLGQNKDKKTDIIAHFNNRQYVWYEGQMTKANGCKLVYIVPKNEIVKQSLLTICMILILTLLSIAIIVLSIKALTSKIVSEIYGIIKSLKLVADCNFSEQLEVKSNDEMGLLVDEFNKTIDALKYQAEHDKMTKFLNAKTFYQKAESFVVPYGDIKFALIRLDIDNFSFINDIYDWSVGNEILVKISWLIRHIFADNSLYGYIGGDVFVICTKYTDEDEMLTKILKLSEAIKTCDNRINITPHFGIYNNMKNGENMNIICDYASVALKTIKGNLLETYVFYNNEFDDKHKDQKFVESQKQIALDNKQFYIVLQPKCDINTGKVVGAEALVRWKSPERQKMISPGKFIPIFEKNGFVIPLDKYVWEETCKVLKKWKENSCRDIPISVNVSRMHIFNAEFVDDFESLIKKYDISPELLEVEVTESALLENVDNLLETVMIDLKSRGFRLLMDDFASGYSSLIALQKLPFDVIKIDKGLIDNIDDPKNKQLVTGVVSMLKNLQKDIVIEGVEYDWQKEAIKDTGCNVIQGFCFSRPVSVDEFEKLAFGKVIE